jgi:excisionase family DNA binding protein
VVTATIRGVVAERVEVGSVLDPLFTLRALAGYSGLGYSTIKRYVRAMPHYRVGGKVLVRRSAFDQWLEQYREIGGPPPRGDALDPNAALRAARVRRAARLATGA